MAASGSHNDGMMKVGLHGPDGQFETMWATPLVIGAPGPSIAWTRAEIPGVVIQIRDAATHAPLAATARGAARWRRDASHVQYAA